MNPLSPAAGDLIIPIAKHLLPKLTHIAPAAGGDHDHHHPLSKVINPLPHLALPPLQPIIAAAAGSHHHHHDEISLPPKIVGAGHDDRPHQLPPLFTGIPDLVGRQAKEKQLPPLFGIPDLVGRPAKEKQLPHHPLDKLVTKKPSLWSSSSSSSHRHPLLEALPPAKLPLIDIAHGRRDHDHDLVGLLKKWPGVDAKPAATMRPAWMIFGRQSPAIVVAPGRNAPWVLPVAGEKPAVVVQQQRRPIVGEKSPAVVVVPPATGCSWWDLSCKMKPLIN